MIPGTLQEQLGKVKDKFNNQGIPDFYDKDGYLNPELVTDYAEKVASEISETSENQVRKYYNEVLGFFMRLRVQEEKDDDVKEAFRKMLAEFRMLKAKVNYDVNRTSKSKESKVSEKFKEFICDMVDQVNKPEDLKAFKLCFEAVVGYFKGGKKS